MGKINVEEIIADGVVDVEEAAALHDEVYADGVVGQEEADALFAINDGVSRNANCPEYGDLFVGAITDFVLADENTPGEVDEDEANYLIGKIKGDGKVDPLELRLLDNIIAKASVVPQSLVDFRNSCN